MQVLECVKKLAEKLKESEACIVAEEDRDSAACKILLLTLLMEVYGLALS